MLLFCVFFFFKQKTAYEMRISDWSSDVCSSDLLQNVHVLVVDRYEDHDVGPFPVVANGYGGAGPDDGVELAGPECSIDLVPLLERNIGVDQADAQSLFLKDFEDRKSTRLNSSH